MWSGKAFYIESMNRPSTWIQSKKSIARKTTGTTRKRVLALAVFALHFPYRADRDRGWMDQGIKEGKCEEGGGEYSWCCWTLKFDSLATGTTTSDGFNSSWHWIIQLAPLNCAASESIFCSLFVGGPLIRARESGLKWFWTGYTDWLVWVACSNWLGSCT